MNSIKKESIGITAIINEVNKFDNIQEDLKKREKEPIWDGNLLLYKKDSAKNEDIVGRIPVQVKGRENVNRDRKETFFDIEFVNIENYKKNNIGTIFFVVEVYPDRSTKIFYKVFDLKTIEEELNGNTKARKTKRFKLKELEENELIRICINFMKNLQIYKNIKPLDEIEVYSKKVVCYDNNTKYELDEIKKSNEVFYETDTYKKAKEKLEKQNIIILHGEPWVGKTSTARRLVMNYIENDYLFIYGNVDDLVEIKNKISVDEKVICLIDDFLGSNVQYLESNIAESTLDKIINVFKNSKDKKLILTTRTYIYNNAKNLFYKFYNATKIKDEYLIDVVDYNYMEKGNILYNHMQKNNLLGTDKHIQMVEDEFYTRVISHDNFNPGVIALICERLKDKENVDVKKYIQEALKDPEQLWEEEYQKLTIYEKIILVIITLFGIKVPERYVEEQFKQIIENEKIQSLDTETFSKSIKILSNSFIKTTFNYREQRELEVCKHSVADFIISKIKKNQIDIERYIKSAKYVEVLHYIDVIFDRNKEIIEIISKKIDIEVNEIKSFYYYKSNIIYRILKLCINESRTKIIENLILEEFNSYSMNLILSILSSPNDIFYKYTFEKFEKEIIEKEDISYLYEIDYVSAYQTFFSTILEILNYKKDSKYMIDSLYCISDALNQNVSEYVEAIINEELIESVAKDIIKGRKLKDIIKSHICDIVTDAIPSLQKLYSQKYYNKLLKILSDECYIQIDEDVLQETIEKIKTNTLNKEQKIIYDNYKIVDKEQIEYIKNKFENGLDIKETEKISNMNTFDEINEDLLKNAYDKWWVRYFTDEIIGRPNISTEIYTEFINKKKHIDYSLKGFAEQFLNYLLYEKNSISEEAKNFLIHLAYNSFLKGEFCIEENTLREYERDFSKSLKELYDIGILVKEGDNVFIVNKYIHLYIAVKELINLDDNLIQIMLEWKNDISFENMNSKIQEIFQLFSAIDNIKFNKEHVILALTVFIDKIETAYKQIGRMNVSKKILSLIDLEIKLDRTFEINSMCWSVYQPIWIVNFITGIDIIKDLAYFDYSIYQSEFFKKCFNEEEDVYILNFNDLIRDKELKQICSKLKVWDYLFDIYLECKNVLKKIKQNVNLNAYGMAKENIIKKYGL